MQAFFDGQIAFDRYLPGTPHEVSDIADMFPYHVCTPQTSAKSGKEQNVARRMESVRRRRSPSCIEEAAAYGNLSYLILLYAQGKFDVLHRKALYEGSDASPLMWAAFKGHLHIVKFLVATAMKECQRLTAETPRNGHHNDGFLYNGGGDRPGARNGGRAPTTYDQQWEAFNTFMNYENSLGHTALNWAIIGGDASVVRFLLDHNADPFHCDRQGFDAAFVAVLNGQLAILLMLLEDSIDAKAITLVKASEDASATGDGDRDAKGKEFAVAFGDGSEEGEDDEASSAAAHYVVDVEAITKVLNDKHKPPPTAAEHTAESGHAAGVDTDASAEWFIRRTNYYYLDPSLRDVEGHNLLHWAAYRNSPATCQYLVERWKYDVNAQDVHGRTPMIWAAREGFAEVIELFCLHGGNRHLSDKDGFTALQYALVRNHSEAVYVLHRVPEMNLTRAVEDGLLDNRKALATLQAYTPVRALRAYGTVKMILTHGLFALQFALGALYMLLSYAFLSVMPPLLSYFPLGIFFFKNVLWTALTSRPVQGSRSEKRSISKEAGLASTLAESVGGTWRFRMREPANLVCVVVMMCLQLFCWTQLGLTPLIHSVFSFNFLFRPFRPLTTSAVSFADSALGRPYDPAAVGASAACNTGNPDSFNRDKCQYERFKRFASDHATQYESEKGQPLLGSGANALAEVGDVDSLLVLTDTDTPLSATQLFSPSHYVGGSGLLSWLFGGDAVRMVAVVLPLLFSLTLLFFALTKVTANASAMQWRPLYAKLLPKRKRHQGSKGSKEEGPYNVEGTLATSPVWRILRSRQYNWLHPRALMLERHTQLPARSFYCPERDVIVHRYDGYSILLDCPIGASNHLFFVLGITFFFLFEFFLFFWAIHQLNFFYSLLSGTRCLYESFFTGVFDGLYTAENAAESLAFLSLAELTDPALLAKCMPHGGYQSVVNLNWLNNFLTLYLHGVPRRQLHYIQLSLLPAYVAQPGSYLRRLLFVVGYYWWPTRANLCGTFMLHFAFCSLLMGFVIALRQWSGVWRGATRMELANPLTPCHNYGGRLIATFPLSIILSTSSKLLQSADGDGAFVFEVENFDDLLRDKNGGGAADGQHAQLCNINLDEEFFYEHTHPGRARVPNREGVHLFTHSIYAESKWSVVNLLYFLAGRAGRRWEGAMSVSDSLKPVISPMLPEYL